MSKSASKIRDVRYSVQKESAKNRRSLSADCRARGSYVPDKKRPSSEERKSGGNKLAVRWGGARKSSINLSEAKRKDIRPLTDKAYQKRKTTELLEFLENSRFAPPISAVKLMTPSKKDFENIFQHLYQYFDPHFTVKKIEEEAPKILKNLGYPFSVNKSAFVYVARTNWPNLLGVLIWLMDLVKFATNIDVNSLFEACTDYARAEVHSILLAYICARHKAGVDDEEEEMATFQNIIKDSLVPNLDELLAVNEEKKGQFTKVEEKIDHVKRLTDQNVLLDKNIEKYDLFLKQMQEHSQNKKEICDRFEEEFRQKESECKGLQEKVSKMQDAYDAQGFDGKKHLNYFETQMQELADKLEKKRSFFKEIQDKYHDSQIKYRKCASEITDSSQSLGKEYNDLMESLKTVLHPLSAIKTPQVHKLCSNFQLEFPTWEIYVNKHCIESVKTFRSSLENVIEKLRRTEEILKRLLASMNQKLNEIEMKKSEVSMKIQLLCIQENKHGQELNSKTKELEEYFPAEDDAAQNELEEYFPAEDDAAQNGVPDPIPPHPDAMPANASDPFLHQREINSLTSDDIITNTVYIGKATRESSRLLHCNRPVRLTLLVPQRSHTCKISTSTRRTISPKTYGTTVQLRVVYTVKGKKKPMQFFNKKAAREFFGRYVYISTCPFLTDFETSNCYCLS